MNLNFSNKLNDDNLTSTKHLKNKINERFDFIIIGAGIIGLTTAYKILEKNSKSSLLIIEKEDKIFKHQSGRNSGVIHSGVYYRPGSKKAENCTNGYKKLIDFAKCNNIDFKITGKLILATNSSEIRALEKLYKFGKENGLKGLKIIGKKEIIKIEPYCTNTHKALYVPQAGIINYLQLGNKLKQCIEEKNGKFLFGNMVKSVINDHNEVKLIVGKHIFKAKNVITCCGVYSDMFLSNKYKNKIRVFPFKGEYFCLGKYNE